jgi:SAM-dependent methyltransferase
MSTPASRLNLSLLQCPVCRSPLAAGDGTSLTCQRGHSYDVVGGIPELLPPEVRNPHDIRGEDKRLERQSHDEYAPDQNLGLPIDERHVFSWLNYYQLFDIRRYLAQAHPKRILVAMCGSGYEFDIWGALTPDVSGVDISTGLLSNAIRRADAAGLTGQFVVGDIEHLPFVDNAFDLVVVHHGLHHLPNLEKAIAEMVRVSRDRCLVCEPVDGPARRLLRRTGLSPTVEPGGTQVRDVKDEDVQRIAAAHGADLTLAKRLFYRRARAPQPTWVHHTADRLHLATLLRPPLAALNAVLGSWIGTKGTFLITKRPR